MTELESEIDRYKNLIDRKRNERVGLFKKIAVNEAEEMLLCDFVCTLKELRKDQETTK